MLKNILGVIAGYASVFITIFLTFTLLYLLLGADGSFKPGTYDVSTIWIMVSILLSILAAVVGGWIVMAISKNIKAAYALAGILFVVGIFSASYAAGMEGSELIREGTVDNFQAMQMAKTPIKVQYLNPIIGAVGVMCETL
jgi:ABC-type uncharacterized transport system permease subunit